MDPIYRKALLECRVQLVEDIGDPVTICDFLLSRHILKDHTKDCIMAEKTNRDKCRHLLDNLPRMGGDRAFDYFVEALRQCHNDLAELLDKTVSELRGGQTPDAETSQAVQPSDSSTSPNGQPTDATASNCAPMETTI